MIDGIKVVRSWPEEIPEGHAYVQDKFRRVKVKDFNYIGLKKIKSDLIHLDWDVAVSPEDLQKFAQYANQDRNRVIVAPMLLYPGGLNGKAVRNHLEPIWNVYGWMEQPPYRLTFGPGDKECLGFGFGMVYLPHLWLDKYPVSYMDDGDFSAWYYTVNGPTPIIWDVKPVHVNYPAPKEV